MKINIDIQDGLNPIVALECVRSVIDYGRVSCNKTKYCLSTSFVTEEGVVWVHTKQYCKSDCFVVKKERTENKAV